MDYRIINSTMGAWRACIGKVARKEYLKTYVVKLMQPDGSIILGRVSEPRFLIQIPLDLKSISEDQRRIIIASRKGQTKQIYEVISTAQ